jgi:hypothetical protein
MTKAFKLKWSISMKSHCLGLLYSILAALMSVAAPVQAEPILMAGITGRDGGTGILVPPGVPFDHFSPYRANLTFGFDGPTSLITDCVNRVGCNFYLDEGRHSGVVEFSAANDPGFANVVSRLTDATDDFLFIGEYVFDDAGAFFAGGQGGSRETDVRQLGRLLTSPNVVQSIDFIRLTYDYSLLSDCGDGCRLATRQHLIQWEIYGVPGPAFNPPPPDTNPPPPPPPDTNPPPRTVSSPATLGLVGAALIALVVTRRRTGRHLPG